MPEKKFADMFVSPEHDETWSPILPSAPETKQPVDSAQSDMAALSSAMQHLIRQVDVLTKTMSIMEVYFILMMLIYLVFSWYFFLYLDRIDLH